LKLKTLVCGQIRKHLAICHVTLIKLESEIHYRKSIRENAMEVRILTQEEVAALRKNPYVRNATATKIRFTVNFKEEFWERYKNGESPPDIFRSMGIDPDVLGRNRTRGIVQRIKQQGIRGIAFTEGYNHVDKNAPADESHPVSQRLSRLEHELAYAKQELEFIKKIILADREARR